MINGTFSQPQTVRRSGRSARGERIEHLPSSVIVAVSDSFIQATYVIYFVMLDDVMVCNFAGQTVTLKCTEENNNIRVFLLDTPVKTAAGPIPDATYLSR